jgi:oligosaccharide repeat unit polymerase
VSVNRLTTICIRPGSNWILFALFVAFKILAITMLVTLGDVNQLELSAATQNQGAAYLYKIPLIGNILLLTLMYDSFRNRRGWGYVVAGLTLFLIDSVLFSSRSSIVMMALWMAVLYHRYYHPISLLKVSLISAPLVVIISLFGLSRDIQIGSIDAYLEAATTLINQPSLILELFMARIDILPTLSAGLDLYHEGILPSLNGGSYFFAFLHFIPRNFWDTKPLLTAALVTAEVYPGGFVDGVNLLSSILLEGILNFSYFGIVLSGTLVAFLCCQVDHAARSDNLVPGVWALSLTTFPMALFNEGFHSNFTGSILYATFLTFLLYKVLRIVGVLKLRSTIK